MKKKSSNLSLLFICFVCSIIQLRAQCQINLEIIESFCVTDSTYTLIIDITTSDLSGDSVELSINNELFGQFGTSAFPLTLSDVVDGDSTSEEISICSVEDNSCCGLLTYESPTSYCADCFNYWINEEFYCDSDSTYEFVLTPEVTFPEHMAPNGNITVFIDGNLYQFEYELGNSYTISGVVLSPNTVWHEIEWYFDEPSCGVAVLHVVSPDCEELCTLDSIAMVDFVCISDTTYNMVVEPSWMIPDELSFLDVEISINGESQELYSQDSTIYNVLNIPISDDGISNLEICVPGIPFDACCFTTEYNEPNCGTTGISQLFEVEEVQIYPNPTRDIIQLENIEGEIKIYNSSGELVIHKKQFDQQIDVGLLPSGVYFLEVVGENIRQAKFIKH